VTNTGNLPMSGIKVTDDKIANVSCPKTALAVGEKMTCTGGPYVITDADVKAGSVKNTATVTGTGPDGEPNGEPPAVAEVPLKAANLTLVKKADKVEDVNGNGKNDAGDKITYSYEVTNSGNVPLTGVKVTDDKIANVSCPKTELGVGEKMTCTGAYTLTADDVTAGQVKNTATAEGIDPEGNKVPPTSNGITVPLKPALLLDKKKDKVEDVNGNGLTDAGDKITYTYEVSNPGAVKVTDIKVTDDKIADVSCLKTELAPGEKMTCTGGPYTVTEADAKAGGVANSAVVTGKDPDGQPVSAGEDGETVRVVKTVGIGDKVWLDRNRNGVQDADEPPLKNVTVTLMDKDGKVLQTTKTDAQGKYQFTFAADTDYVVSFDVSTAVDLPAGVNPADLKPTTKGVGGDKAKDSDIDADGSVKIHTTSEGGDDTIDAGFAGPPRAHLVVDIMKDKITDTNHNGLTDAGDTIAYKYVVTNDGDSKVTGIKVNDNKNANVSCPKTELAPGESMTCTGGPYTITTADAMAGEVVNTAFAAGTGPEGQPVKSDEDKEQVPVAKPVKLVVVKPKPKPGHMAPPTGKLPVTGANALTIGGGGILLLVGGGVLMLMARRRWMPGKEG